MFLFPFLFFPLELYAFNWKKLYNCDYMEAEVFPIPQKIGSYGPKPPHKMIGTDWQNLQDNIPGYTDRIFSCQESIRSNLPATPEATLQEFIKLRDKIYTRGKLKNLEVSRPEDAFEEKMKLSIFSEILGKDMIASSFPFFLKEDPYFWIDRMYGLFVQWGHLIDLNYNKPSRLRLTKTDSPGKDNCYELAKSLNTDRNRWALGTARNAFVLVFRCFDSFPFNPESVDEIFDVGILVNKFFVFSNISTRGYGADNLLKIAQDQKLKFDSSFRMHEFIPAIINTFKDAHVSFKNDCYESFTYVQPLFIQKVRKSGGEK